jgi:hypothetical protein
MRSTSQLALRFMLLFAVALAFHVAPAAAQDSAFPACKGEYAIVRVSEIKEGGTMKGFMDAVAAHQAWYRANGLKDDRIFASPVIVKDDKTGKWGYSDKEVLTYHINPAGPDKTPKRGDDAWNAYVKMYRDNSDMKSEFYTCMPKREMK